MYELNRVRLHNIGPSGARYGDVLLDLSDGGPAIPASTLLPSPGQLSRRPALATLLVLENGGGKSVLIRVLLSTVLPERQTRKGRDALRAFVVSSGSPSHVALEWVNVRTGETLLTGQVLAPAADGKVERLFYSLHPNSTMNLTTLPLAEGRRRLPMNAFNDALRRMDSADKSLRLVVEKRQGEWENHLRRLGLEPDLFAVQQAMNVDEGDAAEAFKTTSGRQFVEWLLSKALDAENFTDLGNAFSSYAKNISQREQLLLDRDFSTATAAAAEELAKQLTGQVTASSAAQTTSAALAQLAAEIHESVRRSERTLQGHREDLAIAKTNVGQRQQIRSDADLVHREVRRRTLALRTDEALAYAEDVERDRDRERVELAAWTLVPKLLASAAAHEKYEVASKLLEDAEQAAGAAQERRDRAGARYAGALHRAGDRCGRQADDLADKDRKARTDAAQAERAAAEDDRVVTTNTLHANALADHTKVVDAQVREAREDGIIENDETVPDAYARLHQEARDCTDQAAREREAHKQLELQARQLDKTAKRLIEPEIKARHAAEAAVHVARDLDTAAQELTDDALLRELAELGSGEDVPGNDSAVWLEANTTTLRSQADAAHRTADERLHVLSTEDRADQHLIDALTVEDNALLPPRKAVKDLLAVLEERNVPATAGWRALEQVVPPYRHAEAIQANPALLDGIVVPDRAALDEARGVLAQSQALPAAAVLVTTQDALTSDYAESDAGFVVEPTPAMHDPAAAAALRSQAEKRMEGRRASIRDLTDHRTAAFGLGVRLGYWLRDHPAGDAERLRAATDTASTNAAEAKTELDEAHDAHAQAVDRLDRYVVVVADADLAATTAISIEDSIAALAAEVVKADEEGVQIAELRAVAEGHRVAAQEHRDDAERLRSRSTEYAVQAESFRRDAAGYTTQLKNVVVGNHTPGADAGESDLAALEIAYREAAEGLRAVQVGEDLRRRFNDAQREVTTIEVELLDEPANVKTHAQKLAASSDAGSRDAIEAAKRRLDRAVEALDTELRKVTERTGQLRAELKSASQQNEVPWISLDEDWTPTNPSEGTTLIERAAAALAEAEARAKAAGESEQTAQRMLRKAEAAARDMTVVHRVLAPSTRKLELPDGSQPFDGSAEQAQQEADRSSEKFSEATEHLREANQAVNSAVAEFRETTSQNRFGKLKAPIYKQLTEIDKTALLARAGQWAAQLTGRAASLTTDLEDSERHRRLLIEQLQHHVSQALTMLEKAERLSRLPDGPEASGGRKILRIGFTKPEPQVLGVRIAETVDEHARAQPQMNGRDLVLRCVGAAVPRDFKVEILKPDSAGRTEYASISEMAKVFSGGQELTGAIMLYCTLAALRSSTRIGARHTRLGGMLILDNPIGKASAAYLLSLQMSMAAALGV